MAQGAGEVVELAEGAHRGAGAEQLLEQRRARAMHADDEDGDRVAVDRLRTGRAGARPPRGQRVDEGARLPRVVAQRRAHRGAHRLERAPRLLVFAQVVQLLVQRARQRRHRIRMQSRRCEQRAQPWYVVRLRRLPPQPRQHPPGGGVARRPREAPFEVRGGGLHAPMVRVQLAADEARHDRAGRPSDRGFRAFEGEPEIAEVAQLRRALHQQLRRRAFARECGRREPAQRFPGIEGAKSPGQPDHRGARARQGAGGAQAPVMCLAIPAAQGLHVGEFEHRIGGVRDDRERREPVAARRVPVPRFRMARRTLAELFESRACHPRMLQKNRPSREGRSRKQPRTVAPSRAPRAPTTYQSYEAVNIT